MPIGWRALHAIQPTGRKTLESGTQNTTALEAMMHSFSMVFTVPYLIFKNENTTWCVVHIFLHTLATIYCRAAVLLEARRICRFANCYAAPFCTYV